MNPQSLASEPKAQVVTDVKTALNQLSYDITNRNEYINTRRRAIYEDGLFENLDFPDGHDKTKYNFCHRTREIMVAQFMGRGFRICSNYYTTDTSIYDDSDPQQKQQKQLVELKNKKTQALAETRNRAIKAMIRDNGGFDIFELGAQIGSETGATVFKHWFDKKAKKYRIVPIENIRNYWAGWSDDNFRDRDFDAFVYQISERQAYKLYGDKLPDGAVFETTTQGIPMSEGLTSDPINTINETQSDPRKTDRPMVTVIAFNGILSGYDFSSGNPKQVDKGKEIPADLLLVGGYLVQVITDPDLMPAYTYIENKHKSAFPWGESDLTDAAIEINRTFIEVMSTSITLYHKEINPTYKAKGFTAGTAPKRQRGRINFLPMQTDQDIELLNSPANYVQIARNYLDELKEEYVREVGIGRVLFDDPTINTGSNQALLTSMKGVIDVVESKQKRWEPALIEIFERGLRVSSKYIPELKEAIDDPDWWLYLEWPNVLRREDVNYQTMWLNLFNAGVISVPTYLEKIGIEDIEEELDRTRDDMVDPIRAAVRSRSLGELAHFEINKSAGIPPWGFNLPKVSIRGEMTPNQEGNIASQQGWQDGPYPPSAGPQGNQGDVADQNLVNEGFLTAPPYQGGTPIQAGPPQQEPQNANPQMTPDMNTGQSMSQPGSGATAVSPQGAVNQANQNNGA